MTEIERVKATRKNMSQVNTVKRILYGVTV